MTPMKRLSGGLDTFKAHINPFFKFLTLNKAEKKYNPYGGPDGFGGSSKGVQADFIIIYSSKAVKNSKISIGFSFNYIDLTEAEQNVIISIKEGEENDNMRSSMPMSLEEFRVKLNQMNKELNYSKPKTDLDAIEKITTIFLEEEFDLQSKVTEAAQHMRKFFEEKNEELGITQLEDKILQGKRKVDKITKEIKNAVEASPEYKRIQELQIELDLLTRSQANFKKKLEKDKSLTELQKEVDKDKKQLEKNKNQLNQNIEDEIKKLPYVVSTRVRHNF